MVKCFLFLYTSGQKFSDAVTIEGLSLVVVEGLTY